MRPDSMHDDGTAAAITGFGVVSSAGVGAAALREAVAEGADRISELGAMGASLPARRGGVFPPEVRAAADAHDVDRAFEACDLALGEALRRADECVPGGAESGRRGLALGTALGGMESVEALARGVPVRAEEHDVLLHQLTARLAAAHALEGSVSTWSATCVSALYALEQARLDLETGRADRVACGGLDTLSRFMQAGFCGLGALHDSAGTADERQGLVLGEAACFVCVEPVARVRERGGRAWGVISGLATRADTIHLTSPDPEGVAMSRAIDACLAQADRSTGDVSWVSVTAAASPLYAQMYDSVFARTFAEGRPEVVTWEGSVAHVLAATGTVGLVHAAHLLAAGRGGAVAGGPVLALTVGFGGQNGATLLEAPERYGLAPAGPASNAEGTS